MAMSRFEQMTFKEVVGLYRQYRKFVLLVLSTVLTLALMFHFTQNPQVAKGSIVVGDSQNSSVQAYSNSVASFGKSLVEGKKANSPLQKHFEYLKSRNFMDQLAQKMIVQIASDSEVSQEIKTKLQVKLQNVPAIEQSKSLASYLSRIIQFKLTSDFDLSVKVYERDAEFSTYVARLTLQSAVENLQDRELQELAKVEEIIKGQKELADLEIKKIDQELGKYKDQPEFLLALSSKDKMGDYVSELLVRENEIRLKMAENKRLMNKMGVGSRREGSRLYGIGGKVEMLRLENQELASRMAEIKASLSKLTVSLKQTTLQAQEIDSLKRKSEIEFVKYKEAANSLAHIDAAKQSVSSRFEVFEWPSRETTSSQYPFLLVLGAALLLSQVIVLVVIMLRYPSQLQPDPEPLNKNRLILLKDFEIQNPIITHDNYKLGYSLDSKQTDLKSEV